MHISGDNGIQARATRHNHPDDRHANMKFCTIYIYLFLLNTFFLGTLSQTPDNSDNEGYSSDEHVPKTAIGTATYHNNRISHHQKKQAFHEAMSTHLGNTKFKKLAQDHGKEAAYSKDLMALHNDYVEGIENGNYFAGSKATKRKKVKDKLSKSS